jgi:hypothetical protein
MKFNLDFNMIPANSFMESLKAFTGFHECIHQNRMV